MDLQVAMELLEERLERTGLKALGWTAGWDRARQRFGACWPQRKRITLSRLLTELNEEAHVLDTILHELAHALTFERHGRVRSHGKEWRAIAEALGASTNARTQTGRLPPGRFALAHRQTGEVFRTFQRKPRRHDYRGRYIRGRKAETLNQLVVIKL